MDTPDPLKRTHRQPKSKFPPVEGPDRDEPPEGAAPREKAGLASELLLALREYAVLLGEHWWVSHAAGETVKVKTWKRIDCPSMGAFHQDGRWAPMVVEGIPDDARSTRVWHVLRYPLGGALDPDTKRARKLVEFTEGYPLGKGQQIAEVAVGEYMVALKTAIDLVCDAIAEEARELGLDLPWSEGSRIPKTQEEIDSIYSRLRDLDPRRSDPVDDDPVTAGRVIDDADPVPPSPGDEESESDGHSVVFDWDTCQLCIDDYCIPLPEGRELAFLRILAGKQNENTVTPVIENGKNWKNAIDQLRRRIKRELKCDLLSEVVVSAKGPVGGYRLNPNVKVRLPEAGSPFLRLGNELDKMFRKSTRKPKGRDLRGEREDEE